MGAIFDAIRTHARSVVGGLTGTGVSALADRLAADRDMLWRPAEEFRETFPETGDRIGQPPADPNANPQEVNLQARPGVMLVEVDAERSTSGD